MVSPFLLLLVLLSLHCPAQLAGDHPSVVVREEHRGDGPSPSPRMSFVMIQMVPCSAVS